MAASSSTIRILTEQAFVIASVLASSPVAIVSLFHMVSISGVNHSTIYLPDNANRPKC